MVVTSFLYRAHPVSTVLGGVIAYTRDQAAALLRNYRDFMPAAPDELTAYAGLISMPDDTPAVGVMACYCGDLTEGERVLKPLRAFGSPVFDAIQPMPFPTMQKLVDARLSAPCMSWRRKMSPNPRARVRSPCAAGHRRRR